MELNLTSLTGLGMSEDLINQMFKSRGINLSAKELRESKSLRKLPEKQKPLSKDNDYSSKDSSELHRKILNAQRIGDFEAVSKILIEAVKKQNLSLVVRRKMVLDLIVSFIEQKKHYEIQDIIDAHRSMFTNCGNFEGECLRASLDLFQHYVRAILGYVVHCDFRILKFFARFTYKKKDTGILTSITKGKLPRSNNSYYPVLLRKSNRVLTSTSKTPMIIY